MKQGKIKLNMRQKHSLQGLFFVTPYIIGIALFFVFPLVVSIQMSFGEVEKLSGFVIKFVGLKNFQELFLEDTTFLPMVYSTVADVIVKIPLIVVFSLLLAILISRKIKCKGFFRVVFFLPFIFGQGVVMRLLVDLGITENVFSLQTNTVIPPSFIAYMGPSVANAVNGFLNIIVTVFWSSSVQILILLSAVQSISPSLYESASVDGATEWEKLWKITIPMCIPSIIVVVIFTITDSFTNATNPILEFLNESGIQSLRFGFAGAASWVYCILILAVVGLSYFIFSKIYKNYK